MGRPRRHIRRRVPRATLTREQLGCLAVGCSPRRRAIADERGLRARADDGHEPRRRAAFVDFVPELPRDAVAFADHADPEEADPAETYRHLAHEHECDALAGRPGGRAHGRRRARVRPRIDALAAELIAEENAEPGDGLVHPRPSPEEPPTNAAFAGGGPCAYPVIGRTCA